MAVYGKLDGTKVSPTSEEIFGTGPSRASQIRSKYELVNKEIEAEIEARNRGREQAGLSGPLSPAEEEAVARQILDRNRKTMSERPGPPAPEFNRPTTGTPVRPASTTVAEKVSRATPFEDIKKEAGYRRPSADAAEVGPPAAPKATLFETIREAAAVDRKPEGTGQTAKAATSAQVPVGGEGTKPSKEQPKTALDKSQGKLQAAVDKIAKGKGDPNKPLPKSKADQIIEKMDQVAGEVSALPEFSQSPARSDLLQLRAEAYRLYKEQADRNEWMDVAERALNAIGQLASARSATGQQVGGLPLSRTDYGARTERAFREYQAELGLAGEKVREEERAAERQEAKKEKEIGRRLGTLGERLKSERIAEEDVQALKRANIAAGGRAADDAARAAAARKKDELDIIDSFLKQEKEQTSLLGKQISIVQKLAGGGAKTKDQAVALLAQAENRPLAEVEQEIASESGFNNQLNKIYASKEDVRKSELSKLLNDLSKKQQLSYQQQNSLREQERNILRYGPAAAQPAATAAAAAPAGQAAPESDMVIAQIPGNEPMKMSREQAARAKQKYPNLVITPVR